MHCFGPIAPLLQRTLASEDATGFKPGEYVTAYDDSAEHTGKLSFSYMNKILQRWYTEGKTENQPKTTSKSKSSVSTQKTDTSYDLDKFKDKVRSGIKYERKGKK